MTRRLLPWLALIALLVQAAIPVGLMPDFAAQEPGLHLMICDGVMPLTGEKTPKMSMPGMKMPAGSMPTHPHGKMPLCPYAMAAALWFTVALLVAVLRLKPARAAPSSFHRFTPHRLRFGNAAPRAPPFSAAI